VFPIDSRRTGIVRTICDRTAHLCASNLTKQAIACEGHSFIKTAFAVRSPQGTFPLYYCHCGELALLHDDALHTMLALTDEGCERELSGCGLSS
jgi:hypothetical protein